MQLLDADVLIDIRRGFGPATQWFNALTEMPGVPCYVVFELLQGCRNQSDVLKVQALIAPLPILWLSEAGCKNALAEYASRYLSHSLGIMDALIAACAVEHDATLCTFNTRHFRAVPGLVIEQPYSR